jgi:rhamnosyltransferase subunit B
MVPSLPEGPPARRSLRIVLTNIGTFGDVNPLIALALELRRRGHRPALAVPELYRGRIEPLGIGFSPVRPDIDPEDSRMAAMVYDLKKGTERGLREFLFPVLRQSYDDLLAAVRADGGADLLLAGELAYAGPIVAEVTGIPWASYVLAPLSFFSAYDPPVLPPYPTLARVQPFLPGMGHVIAHFARWVTRKWADPVYALRAEVGLGRGLDPLFDAKHSPQLVLALFSPVLGTVQPDWPVSSRITGFVFYDGNRGEGDGIKSSLPPELEEFLSSGSAPLVFTLGSAAVHNAGDFFEQSARAAAILGQRAVLLIGSDPRNVPKQPPSPELCITPYAPYSQIFPRASLVIHQGGVGTTAQALQAGKPMLVMPYSHDQPDNARRVKRLGVAEVIQRKHYTAEKAAGMIGKMLAEPSYRKKATAIRKELLTEDGLQQACDALEEVARQGAHPAKASISLLQTR